MLESCPRSSPVRDVLPELLRRWQAGESVAVASVVDTWNSAPRQPGAAMLVTGDETVIGSVSGGCVESAVYEVASQVRSDGIPRLQRYGVSDDHAFAVGLTCGGTLDVFIERVDRDSFPELIGVADDIDRGRPVAVATVVDADPPATGRRMILRPGSVHGTLGGARLDAAVRDDARGYLEHGRTALLRYGRHGERLDDQIGVFLATYSPRPRLLVFGATDFAAAMARVGSFLGYRVTICDARPLFATAERFPDAEEVVVDWPHRYLARTELDGRTAICVLTHDAKFELPLLEQALRMPLAYVGVMGSRRTTDDRLMRLRERGLTADELGRLHAPVGLDIGARTPEETATSIAAEIIACRWGGSGTPLRQVTGPIHHVPPAPQQSRRTPLGT
jgi:xanthine dehydrogenase accessory factor